VKKETGAQPLAASVTTNGRRQSRVPFLRWRRRVAAVVLCGAAAALLWASHVALLRGMARWIDVGRQPQRADYVMVLGGGEETRPFAAAALVRAGFADRALVARVAPLPADMAKLVAESSEIDRRVLVARGVKPSHVAVLPGAAKSTYDEATALESFLDAHPLASVLVVTDGYHTRRSRWAFRHVLGEQASQVAFVSAPTDEFDLNYWWRDQWGLAAVGAEYLKLAAYLVYYGHFLPWLAACLVLAAVARCAKTHVGYASAYTLRGRKCSNPKRKRGP
jgi:uncharacterized SAM-binding protein YcdF (DUF218 family)